jgi:hypothetical protein
MDRIAILPGKKTKGMLHMKMSMKSSLRPILKAEASP